MIFYLGSKMGIMFIAVPIISTYCTVKDIDLIAVILNKLKIGKKDKPKEAAQDNLSGEDDKGNNQ